MSRNQLDRYHQLIQLVRGRRGATRQWLQQELAVSRATLTRYISELREVLGHPIRFDREIGGYVWEDKGFYRGRELPGVWYSEEQIHALLAMEAVIGALSPELIPRTLQPIHDQLDRAIEAASAKPDELRRRIKLIPVGRRSLKGEYFPEVASAVVIRKQIRIRYYARTTDRETERAVSPQRLINYRANWYLEAWCHRSDDLRNFALDGIRSLEVLDEPAKDIDVQDLDDKFMAAYGIYADGRPRWAKLRFSAHQSRWARDEIWHPMQKGRLRRDGRWELEIPFTSTQEVAMEVLRYGDAVEVLSPKDLREKVAQGHADAARLYRDD